MNHRRAEQEGKKQIKCFISPRSKRDEQYMCSLKKENKPINSQVKGKYQGTLKYGALSLQNEKCRNFNPLCRGFQIIL